MPSIRDCEIDIQVLLCKVRTSVNLNTVMIFAQNSQQKNKCEEIVTFRQFLLTFYDQGVK